MIDDDTTTAYPERLLAGSRRLIKALRETRHRPKSYSGRGMYGARCVAVDGDDLDLFQLGRDLAEVPGLDSPSVDSMGMGIVAYWRDMPWPHDEPHEAEDEDEEG